MISANCKKKGLNNRPEGFSPIDYRNAQELWNIISQYTYSPIIYKNNYRLGDNFLYSDLCILDVDNDETSIYSLEDCIRDFGDLTIMIGSTRSHMLEKHGVIAPRFRILIPWEHRITCPFSYKKSIEYAQGLCEGSDKSTKDLARMFYPCREILYVNGGGEKMPVIPVAADVIKNQKNYEHYKRAKSLQDPLPQHIKDFLTLGKVFGGSRNRSVYTSARALLEKGFTFAEVESLIAGSPFDRRGFPHAELKTCLASAEKKEKRARTTTLPLSPAQQDS